MHTNGWPGTGAVQLASGLSKRDVKGRGSTSNGTGDVAREAEQLGTRLGLTKLSHGSEVNFY